VAQKQRYRAVVEYDGTEFQGFQIQAKGRTVQGDIERCLQQVTQSAVRIEGAGRTDAGVHATGQVIAFGVSWRHSLEDLQRALNATFPSDIVVSDLQPTTSAFHPRFSALSRTYRYQIQNQPWPNVLLRLYAFNVRKKLDVPAMARASRLLIGSHDFASFGKPPQGNNTVRQVMQAGWSVLDDNRLVFSITANAFLYRMVRTIVGTLIQVGLGRLTQNDFAEILRSGDLTRSAPPAPAHGLCLIQVTYPEGFTAG
jgi:tRNA pseudouridine38-40 synthase